MAGHIFDKVIATISERNKEKYQELAVTEIIQPDSDKLMVLLPPWHVTAILWNRLKKQLLRQGYSVLAYEASETILSSDGKHVAQSFLSIKEAALKDIARLNQTGQFKTIDVAGLSLGTVSALYIAVSGVKINKLILVSPSVDLAEGIYYGRRTRKIRSQLDAASKTLEIYRQEMHAMTMRKEYTIHAQEVEIVLSDADHIIPYYLGLELAQSLRSKGIKTTLVRRPYRGHYLTFILYCLTGKSPKSTI